MSPRAVLARSSIRNGRRPLLEYGRIDLDALLESRLKPRLGPAAEAAVRRQFTDRAEPRVYSRLFGARNRSLLPAPHAHVVISRERPRTNGDRRHGGEYRPRNGSIWTRS